MIGESAIEVPHVKPAGQRHNNDWQGARSWLGKPGLNSVIRVEPTRKRRVSPAPIFKGKVPTMSFLSLTCLQASLSLTKRKDRPGRSAWRWLGVMAATWMLAACAHVAAPDGRPAKASAAPDWRNLPKPEIAPSLANWRKLDPENVLVIETNRGEITIELYADIAPMHVAQIKKLARRGFYDGIIFHRVIDRFMAQTGDPTGTGEGGSDLPNIKAEFTFRRPLDGDFVATAEQAGLRLGFFHALPVASQADWIASRSQDQRVTAWGLHCPGVASMARDDDPNSANSQIFLMRDPYLSLDKRYSIWGMAIHGREIIKAIQTGEPPAQPDKMIRVRVLADIPAAERKNYLVMRTDAPGLKRLIGQIRAAKGADFSPCDLELPVLGPLKQPDFATFGEVAPNS